jgi:hypothetical protein
MNGQQPTPDELAGQARKNRLAAIIFGILAAVALVVCFLDYQRGNMWLVAFQAVLTAVWAWISWSYWQRATR